MGLPLVFSVFSCFDVASLFTAISVKLSLRSRLYVSLQSIGVRANSDRGTFLETPENFSGPKSHF